MAQAAAATPATSFPHSLEVDHVQSEDSRDTSISSVSVAAAAATTTTTTEQLGHPSQSSNVILQKLPSNAGSDQGIESDSAGSLLLTDHLGDTAPMELATSFVFADQAFAREVDDDWPLETHEQQQTAIQFAMEQQIFLRAALALLSERDLRAPTLGMMDPNVLKSGPLKKASHLMKSIWKVKYVEIRRGMLSYYEDAISGGEILRKNIPLQANDCKCRAVRLHQTALQLTPGGAIFELAAGGAKRLWLCTSKEERQSWMQAIFTATVGGSVTSSGEPGATDHSGRIRHVSPRSPFRNDLRLYLKIQSSLRQASCKLDYVAGLMMLENNPIKVPIKWIAKQTLLYNIQNGVDAVKSGIGMGGGGGVQQGATAANFRELSVDSSVEQLWRDLQRDSVSINGVVWQGNEAYGPEAIMGAVAHTILRASLKSTGGRSGMMESQALSYARDILLSGNRTRSGGDSYFCVTTLCNNDELVVLTPGGMEAKPVALVVTEESADALRAEGRVKIKSGWIKKRSGLRGSWKGYFFVLSEGTLSYYEGALPRPHGLRGVIILADATIKVTRRHNNEPSYFVLTIAAKDGKEHVLRMDHQGRLVEWIYALERESKAKVGEASSRFYKRKSSNSNEETPKNPDGTSLDGKALAEQATEAHAMRLGLDIATVKERIATLALQTSSAVRIAVQACTEYNICTTDPSGITEEDTWGVIRTHFEQSFRVTGGPGGRITRGEEIVRLTLLQYGGKTVTVPDIPASPKRKGGKGPARMFRNFSTGAPDETTEQAECKY